MTSEFETAHCNTCGGERNHKQIFVDISRWDAEIDGYEIYGSNKYEALKCAGCDAVQFRHITTHSEDYSPTITRFPPAIFRPQPQWMDELRFELTAEEQSVADLLSEIYTAVQNNQRRLAAMGVRSLIEQIMTSRTGDQGTFAGTLREFHAKGYVSKIQEQYLETILDAGHATVHRNFAPKASEVITLIDITEHLIQTIYLHAPKVDSLKKRVPPKKSKV